MPLAAWIEYLAVAACAMSAVLAAEGKGIDLFGVLVLALVTAVGGGTIRDLCLGARPLFWIEQPLYVWTALAAAVVTFVLVRFVSLPAKTLGLIDAVGLALFGIAGTEKALAFGAPGIVAVLLGIVTGVAGGILRDVLRTEVPIVFRKDTELYATAVFAGSLLFIGLREWTEDAKWHRWLAMGVIIALRLAAMRWKWRLPMLRLRLR
ncbi:putative membrane protein YeiH [Haloferula luteola]|uniref:Putative membrane protein YeiH n=1 Tax=Haloferula luteola TaxID=595692 RepID=A0A840VBZ0_9BACT|nr:trimeric intracellular cation channel family protein [Haloferula luteola]MBB5353064.1 putative membrane protein YeiH [Haloferula luteola]